MSNLKITEFEFNYEVTFNYDDKIIEILRQVQGRRYMGLTKSWVIPKSSFNQLTSLLKTEAIPYKVEDGSHSEDQIESLGASENDFSLPLNKSFKAKPVTHLRVHQLKKLGV